ncbi:MAG: septum formation initiator family protein [bacterium]|nr:septum formation initiator family protein [bacterium]
MSIPLSLKRGRSPKKMLAGGRWVAIVGVVLLLGIGVALTRDVARKTRIKHEVATLESDIGSLERRNEELAGLIEYFQSDAFKEREARSKLNVQLPGEKVIEVQLPNRTQPVVPNQVAQALPNSNVAKWWVYLFAERDL